MAGAAFLLAISAGPAAAEQSRAVLTVTATVQASCAVALEEPAPTSARVQCSSGTSGSSMTAAGHDDNPIDEAETILGEPVRHDGRLLFTAPVQPAQAEQAQARIETNSSNTPYLTIHY